MGDKPLHLDIPQNMEIDSDMSCYAKYQQKLGDFCGFFRTWIPCLFCCCLDYPYQQIQQSSNGILSRFGKYVKTLNAGLHYVNPCTDTLQSIDMRLQVIDLNKQSILTKDNVIVAIDAAVYYRIVEPRLSTFRVENIVLAISQLTYSILKNTCGKFILQDLFEKRAEIATDLREQIDKYTDDWGVHIDNIYMKDIQLNEDLQQSLSSAARERRQAESKLILAKADVEAAKLMKQASDQLNSKAAMQIRYLETIKTISQHGARVIFLPQDSDAERQRHRITQGLIA
ncbi:spfh domain band 7 family protein [Ichthyophthirius multifiliis]|uniref:Spfh domain band 7 family protein n=1 Tax=Ichthyophthirius multifiliis TaxID=5932 RepID=G0R6G3_ICHMU|nr:spfh domain band 7 family protein [Ichthyophthirius multifiliis]EGR26930.1 spfh domain band 7 family protein [Ichthyophthirius multifiliis]|eukprot:XP_004023814.1 spfh domain band 7 family protein [Ichthyophthirius multifiliis]